MKRLFTLLLAMALAWPAAAQDYPSRPVQMIIPFPAGGNTDLMARALQQELSRILGGTVVAVNRGVISDPAAPFGGMKESGLGLEGGFAGIHEFLETQYIGVTL
jgi:hypothetical protein